MPEKVEHGLVFGIEVKEAFVALMGLVVSVAYAEGGRMRDENIYASLFPDLPFQPFHALGHLRLGVKEGSGVVSFAAAQTAYAEPPVFYQPSVYAFAAQRGVEIEAGVMVPANVEKGAGIMVTRKLRLKAFKSPQEIIISTPLKTAGSK
jgi:hypothetical protein